MTVESGFGFEQVATEIIRGIAATVADQPGLTQAQKFSSQQTAVYSAMAFLPRDPAETMLAGQCVVYDHMLRDGARDLLRGQAELIKLRARPGIVATGKVFLSTLDMLLRLQGRAADKVAVVQPQKDEGPSAKVAEAMLAEEPAAAVPQPEISNKAAKPKPTANRHALMNGTTHSPLTSGSAAILGRRPPANAHVLELARIGPGG